MNIRLGNCHLKGSSKEICTNKLGKLALVSYSTINKQIRHSDFTMTFLICMLCISKSTEASDIQADSMFKSAMAVSTFLSTEIL